MCEGIGGKIDLSSIHEGYSFMREEGWEQLELYFRFNETLLTPPGFGWVLHLPLLTAVYGFHGVKYFSSFHVDARCVCSPDHINLDLIDSFEERFIDISSSTTSPSATKLYKETWKNRRSEGWSL